LYSRGYSLYLSDGNSWWITGSRDTHEWVDELATIMKLEKGGAPNGSPKIAFATVDSLTENTDNAMERASDHVLSQLRLLGADTGWMLHAHQDMRMWFHKDMDNVLYEIRKNERKITNYMSMWISLQPILQRSISSGGLPFHAGLAELGGRGVLFAAQGETGKSTTCRRFPDYWNTLCDDEALVVLSKQKEYRVHPFPTWSDYLCQREAGTWNVQYSVPLSGIFFLEQSETDVVVPLGTGEAAVLISESASQVCYKFWREADGEYQKRFRSEIFSVACEIARRIPVFRLCISLHGKFWEEIENAIA